MTSQLIYVTTLSLASDDDAFDLILGEDYEAADDFMDID
jgi:hypothetical protein